MIVTVKLFYELVEGVESLSKMEVINQVLDSQPEKLFATGEILRYELKTGSIDWDDIVEVEK